MSDLRRLDDDAKRCGELLTALGLFGQVSGEDDA